MWHLWCMPGEWWGDAVGAARSVAFHALSWTPAWGPAPVLPLSLPAAGSRRTTARTASPRAATACGASLAWWPPRCRWAQAAGSMLVSTTGLTFACGLWPRRKIGFIPVGQSVSPCLLKCALQELCISQCSDIFHAKSFADLAQLQVGIGMHWLLACACRAQQPSGLLPRAMPAAGPAAQHTFHPARLPLIARTGARDTGNHIHGGAGQPCRSGAALRPAPAAQPHAVGQQVRAGRSWWCCEKSWQLRMALGSPIRRCPVVHPRCQGVNNQLLGKRSLPPPQDARGGGGAAAGWLPRQPAEAQGPHIAGHQLARWACKGD